MAEITRWRSVPAQRRLTTGCVLLLCCVGPFPAVAQPGAGAQDARTRWRYENGQFRRAADRWVEKADNGSPVQFKEVTRTPEYVELNDADRDIGVRLYKDRMFIRQPGTKAFTDFRAGRWVGDALELTTGGEIDAAFAPTVGRLTVLFYECYPTLLERFESPATPAARHVRVVFKRGMKVPAYATGSEISVSVDWLKDHPEDIGLLTHELTHTVQAYPAGAPGWMVEGIADYARYRYGPKRQPGWALPESLGPKKKVTDGYGTTARFLVWLDEQHPGVVDKLHRRLQSREFEVADFTTFTGKTVEELWAECVAALRKK